MNKINLLIVSHEIKLAGVGRFINSLLPDLSEYYSIHIFCVRDVFTLQSSDLDITKYEMPLFSHKNIYFVSVFRKILIEKKINLILFNDLYYSIRYRMYMKITGIKVPYFIVHHSDELSFPHLSLLKKVFHQLLFQFCREDAQVNVLVAAHLEKKLDKRNVLGKQRKIIYNGMVIERNKHIANNENTNGTLKILYLGRLSSEKNPLLFCQIANKLRVNSNFQFLIAGDGPEKVAVDKYIADNNLTNVCCLGFVKDIKSLLNRVDVLIVTSRTEGCPYQVIEAMVAGVIVLSTAIDYAFEFQKNGFPIHIASDENDFITMLKKISDNKKDCRLKLIESEGLIDKFFSIQSCVKEYKTTIDSILSFCSKLI